VNVVGVIGFLVDSGAVRIALVGDNERGGDVIYGRTYLLLVITDSRNNGID